MQIQICQKNPKKNRHTDVAELQGENFAEQNSRQESENPGMDFPRRPTPPWRGAIALLTAQVPELCRRAGAGSNGGGWAPRNPAKRDKLPSVAFYPASFLAKTCQVFLLTNDAPSMALLVCK